MDTDVTRIFLVGRHGALLVERIWLLVLQRSPSASLGMTDERGESSVLILGGMKMVRIPAPDFDLAATLNCGQVFHWEMHNDGFVGTIGEVPVYVEQQNDSLKVALASSRSVEGRRQDADVTIQTYFALDHPLGEICASFPRDETMIAANDFCRGLRIIRQPKWECLATFICSSMKQVAHIRQISHALRNCFGNEHSVNRRQVFAFPSAKRIAGTTEKALRNCGLGYRAKNLHATGQRVAAGEAKLESWTELPDSDVHARLCDLPGVGAKIANCVMLFAYERTRAFPIDVWIARVLRERYFERKSRPTDKRLREFAADYFGEHGGYAQQYLFHHARMTTKRRKSGKVPA